MQKISQGVKPRPLGRILGVCGIVARKPHPLWWEGCHEKNESDCKILLNPLSKESQSI